MIWVAFSAKNLVNLSKSFLSCTLNFWAILTQTLSSHNSTHSTIHTVFLPVEMQLLAREYRHQHPANSQPESDTTRRVRDATNARNVRYVTDLLEQGTWWGAIWERSLRTWYTTLDLLELETRSQKTRLEYYKLSFRTDLKRLADTIPFLDWIGNPCKFQYGRLHIFQIVAWVRRGWKYWEKEERTRVRCSAACQRKE